MGQEKRLTELSRTSGWAAKIGPEDLSKILARLPRPQDDRLLAYWEGGEDAALWKLTDQRVGILTVDFITPVVDDPYTWGQIAAANSISDVFAMGGTPLICLNLVAFPLNCLPLETLQAVMEGGASKVAQAGAFLMGGHSVEDAEPKYGLCVFGEAPQQMLWRTTGAQPGDLLILTKPLGTGVAATAIKAGMASDSMAHQAAHWMATLNDLPRHMTDLQRRAIHGATDVTGFGLAGHALDMLTPKDLDFELQLDDLPLLDGVVEAAGMGLMAAGSYRNRDLYSPQVIGLAPSDQAADFLYDPQTSGGLLLACNPRFANEILDLARQKGCSQAAVIGQCVTGTGKIKLF